ncbi:mucoidy inhibitor a [Moniliophthora roreri MCA 2997]|uniref:Mucoidy inhibitor a n=2 Tax=Moniliophthora roreri TaxID=221103 RepID=V2YFY3_MONRO|nr:mucoidy inhibitor a [Moniliophthora roreri MCA 2997]
MSTSSSQQEEIHWIGLSTSNGSKITGVNLYKGRAQISRQFRFAVKKGHNQVRITELPWSMAADSLRVEGRGKATIHDVNLARAKDEHEVTSSTLEELLLRKNRTEKALERCKKSISALSSFLDTLNAQHTKSTDLPTLMNDYDQAAGQLDDKLIQLEAELKGIRKEIDDETRRISPKPFYELGWIASVGVIAESDSEVELVLIYAVSSATWKAGYDIRVETSGVQKPVTLIYKAIVSQSTGESWDHVPLTLETASPTFGVSLPKLEQWSVSVHQPGPVLLKSAKPRASRSGSTIRYRCLAVNDEEGSDDEGDLMGYATSSVTSKGNISATFRVPGLVTIPSTADERSFTIVELKLDAVMTWVSVPKVDTRVHLKAKIRNESDYTLLAGKSSVYVDGSFISKSNVPPVSPLETFDCPLGLDPAVRITYHPVVKKASTSGFYSKSTSYAYSQRLTVHNTKSVPIPLLKIIDQIPVSEDSSIAVKLVNPSLKLPTGSSNGSTSLSAHAGPSATGVAASPSSTIIGTANENSMKRLSLSVSRTSVHMKSPSAPALASMTEVVAASAGPTIRVADGVMAQWDGADEVSVDVEALGKNGKINWLCSVPAGEKMNLTLQWEVSMPVKTQVVGL